MDYAQQQRDPTKHAIGVAFVILMHVLLIWALLSGLGRAIVEVVKKPLTATIIEELKVPPPPPPPPKKVMEQPKIQPPVQTYVPPPDVPVQTNTAPTITETTTVAPTEPHVIAPPAVIAPPSRISIAISSRSNAICASRRTTPRCRFAPTVAITRRTACKAACLGHPPT